MASRTLPLSRPQFTHLCREPLQPWHPVVCSRTGGGGSDTKERSLGLVSALDPLRSLSGYPGILPSCGHAHSEGHKGLLFPQVPWGERSPPLGYEWVASRAGGGKKHSLPPLPRLEQDSDIPRRTVDRGRGGRTAQRQHSVWEGREMGTQEGAHKGLWWTRERQAWVCVILVGPV